MRKTIFCASLLCVLISTSAMGVDGDMGGAEPNGSAEHPYLIEDLADFDVFADPNNAAIYWASGVQTKLMTNIDLSGTTYNTAVIAPEITSITIWSFEGIPFEGSFDGNDFIVSNLTIDADDQRRDYLGLFGYIEGQDAEVKNLDIINISIAGTSDSECLGGVCGANFRGKITSCYITGIVSGGDYVGGLCGSNNLGLIVNCYTEGTIKGRLGVGGLVGINGNSGYPAKCYSTCSVSGDTEVGGLVGNNRQSPLSNCYAEGIVVGNNRIGGLCGENSGNLRNSYAAGTVAGTGSDIGGLCGRSFTNITNSYFLESSGPDNGLGTRLTDAQMKQQVIFSGWDFTTPVWMMLRPDEDYPRLAWQQIFPGDIAGLYGTDMVDFAYVAKYWGLTGCNSGTDCGRADIDASGDVGLGDLAGIAADWVK